MTKILGLRLTSEEREKLAGVTVGATTSGANTGDESSATTAVEGVVELATDGENAANVVVQGNDARLSDSRTPTAHTSTHIQGGTDEVDGDKLDIDFTPTNYTPDVTPSEVTSVDHLSSHLNGIDIKLASVGGNQDFTSAWKITSVLTPATILAHTHDYNPTGLSTAIAVRISSDNNYDLTGITAQVDGTILYLFNVGAKDIKLKNNNTNSIAINRFLITGDKTLKPNNTAQLFYDGVSNMWRIISTYLT